jgi:hypothetical protein
MGDGMTASVSLTAKSQSRIEMKAEMLSRSLPRADSHWQLVISELTTRNTREEHFEWLREHFRICHDLCYLCHGKYHVLHVP